MDRDASHSGEITAILSRVRDDPRAIDELFKAVYDELKRIAHREMRGERDDHTLSPTALVHEAYLRAMDRQILDSVENRRHLYASMTRVMRQLLVDHARRRNAKKRGGDRRLIRLDAALDAFEEAHRFKFLEFDEALSELTGLDARQGQIVELRFVGELSVGEVARQVGVSKSTVEKSLASATAWLKLRLID